MAGGVWRFGVLGPLVLEREGAAVAIASARQRVLLAVLLEAGGVPVSRDRLIDELWGEHPPATAISTLHVHLSKLRALLGDLLVLDSAGYKLAPGRYEVDISRFDALVEQARADPARAASLLGEALCLFRGEPLCDVAADGTIGRWRRELEEKRLQAVVARVDAELAAGAAGELISELERLLAKHQFEERLWGQLMLALYRDERQAEALEQFQRARRLFTDELGIEPGDGLRRLHGRILEQDPKLSIAEPPRRAAQRRIEPSPPARQAWLPRAATRLIGRELDLIELEALSSDPFCRLISLNGPGGVGKTRLAIAFAEQWAPDFADGAVFVDLLALADASQVRGAIATRLARREDSSSPTEEELYRYLRSRELLLVLDNFEHVLPAAELVAELLDDAAGLRVLVTSRVTLRLRGEQRFQVEPLAADTAGGPAVELFLQCARAVDRRFAADGDALTVIARICHALDGLPLAIELAGARAQALTVEEIAAQLSEPLTIGAGALRDLPDRQQTVERALQFSYKLLSDESKRVFRAASIFQDTFTREALAAVSGAVELDELLEGSLVHLAATPGRFRMLQLVRAFGRDRLAASGELGAVTAARCRYFADRYAVVAADEVPVEPGRVAREMGPDHADIRAAIADAIAAGDDRTAVTLARALQPIWMTSFLEESGGIVDAVLGAFTVPAADELHLLKMAGFANSYRPRNSYWTLRRVRRAGELGHVGPRVAGLSNLITQALSRRDIDDARALRDELLPLLDNSQLTVRTRAAGMCAAGWCAYSEGSFDTAVDFGERSVAAAASDGHPHMLTMARQMLVQARSARNGTIALGALTEIVEGARTVAIADLCVATFLIVARYSVAFDQALAGELLAHADRLFATMGGDPWPELENKQATLAILGLSDVTPLLARTPARETGEILSELAQWLAARPPGEAAPFAAPPPLRVC
jgi:predicted ATPase/DNA-binding SARP family transcriptional activator